VIRILTEDVPTNQRELEAIFISRKIDFTMFFGKGCYEGNIERSLVIDLIGVDYDKAIEVAEEIRELNNQKSILVQRLAGETIEVTKKGWDVYKYRDAKN
jgi:hypothetical protein